MKLKIGTCNNCGKTLPDSAGCSHASCGGFFVAQRTGSVLRQGPSLWWSTWGQVSAYLAKNPDSPYKVMRWNMSNRGCLVDKVTDEAIAHLNRLTEQSETRKR